MSITQITDTETRLTNTLRVTTEALQAVTAERDEHRLNALDKTILLTGLHELYGKMKAERDDLSKLLHQALDERDHYVKERDGLRADAERYRFIHTRPEWLGWDEDFDHRDIDAIVDRAMKGTS